MAKNVKKIGLSTKKFYLKSSFVVCRRVEYWQSRAKFLAVGLLFFSSLTEKEQKNLFYQKNIFHKLSNWRSKAPFWQRRRETFAKRPIIFTSMCQKRWKLCCFHATFFLSGSCGKEKAVPTTRPKDVCKQTKKTLTHCPKTVKTWFCARKKSLQIDPMDQKKALGTNLLDTTFLRRWFSLNVRKTFEKSLFLKSVFFFQLYCWTRRMHIRLPRSSFFNNWSEKFCSISDNDGGNIHRKKLSLKTLFWTPTENAVLKSTLENFLTTNSTLEIFRELSKND